MQGKHWPWGALKQYDYDLIMIDPAWKFKNWSLAGEERNASAHYTCMELEEIKALPVRLLANPEGCVLVLWTTNPMIDKGLEILKALGFEFKTAATWHKKTKHGKTGFGTGYVLRGASEPLLIGTIGSPKYSRKARTIFEGRLGEHSEKPDEAYEWAEGILKKPEEMEGGLFPGLKPKPLRYCEIFSRKGRAGWDVYGDEAGKFQGTAGAGDIIECAAI